MNPNANVDTGRYRWGTRMASILLLRQPFPNHEQERRETYNYAVSVWNPNITRTYSDERALHQLSEMNQCGCHRPTCGYCGGPLKEWVGAIIDKYVTMDAQNDTFTQFADYNALQHVKALMHTMLAVIKRHIKLTDRRERKPREVAEKELGTALQFELQTLSHTRATPPVCYIAVFEMIKFSYTNFKYRLYLHPRAIALFLNWTTTKISAEPINLAWALEFSGLRFHYLLDQAVLLLAHAFYISDYDFAARMEYEVIVVAVCMLANTLYDIIFRKAPNALHPLMEEFGQQDMDGYHRLADKFTDSLFLLLRIIRCLETVFHNLPGLTVPRWPAIGIGFIWRNMVGMSRHIGMIDPFKMRPLARELKAYVRRFTPPPPDPAHPEVAALCPWMDIEHNTLTMVNMYLAHRFSNSLQHAVASLPPAAVPGITKLQMQQLFTNGTMASE